MDVSHCFILPLFVLSQHPFSLFVCLGSCLSSHLCTNSNCLSFSPVRRPSVCPPLHTTPCPLPPPLCPIRPATHLALFVLCRYLFSSRTSYSFCLLPTSLSLIYPLVYAYFCLFQFKSIYRFSSVVHLS